MSTELANQMNENVPEVHSNTDAILDNPPNVGLDLLTNSQEELILSEANHFNIQNSMASTSSVQHFHFHGPVNFYNK